MHLDSIPRHCLAWVVCSLHQHLLTQLGQPALHHTELKKDLFIHHPKIVVQAGDNASEDPLLLPTLKVPGILGQVCGHRRSEQTRRRTQKRC